MRAFSALLDERSQPSLRQIIGRLLASAQMADIAIAHLRLAGLDLTPLEIAGLQRCRVMLGHLDASSLLDTARLSNEGHERPEVLRSFARSGRLEIRTAPHHVWTPDFSVFEGLPGNQCVALVGAHYFDRPYPRFGLAFTSVLTTGAAVHACRTRFDELWDAGYDVLTVVVDTLERFAA